MAQVRLEPCRKAGMRVQGVKVDPRHDPGNKKRAADPATRCNHSGSLVGARGFEPPTRFTLWQGTHKDVLLDGI